MYIKTIEIEGFKSYGTRTVINGFDPLFNAITGLNGSGKSNILDSICFVLGITNLSQVRASSLQELVYKSGQAGINKATVSITFDNSDPAGSPMGYQDQKEIKITRVVVLGGKNKYMINGTTAHNNRIHDFFQSIQLNVNNPHFLIMQGRITKVLNMKPMEILSMVEEAAGTRMYETKKENALKLMEKKEARLREINTILTEHITPTLLRLKEERKVYLEYTKIVKELDHLSKLYIAWQYMAAQDTSKKSSDEEQKLIDTMKAGQDEIEELKKQATEADVKIKEIEKKKDEEAGGKLQELEEQLKKSQITDTKVSSRLQNLKEAYNDETRKTSDLKKNLADDKSLVTKKEKELQNAEKKLGDMQIMCDKDAEAAVAAHKHFQAVSAGLSASNDGEDASLADQLMKTRDDMSKAETEAQQAEMALKHMKKDLEKKKSDCKKMDSEYASDQKVFQAKEKDVNRIEAEMKSLNYEEGQSQRLQMEKTKLMRYMENLKEKLDSLNSRFPQLSFDYRDPVKNFDRRKVYGLVCTLIELKDPKTATALDLTAGGRLYNVVVDNEVTGKLILDKGQLKRRYTIIPLNKITGRAIENRLVQEAERLVGNKNVSTALSLVSYKAELQPAMTYVFGGSFVCSDMQSAKKVTFANNIKKRSVTLEGEVFDPSGTLSGGSMGQRGKLLAELAQLANIRKELGEKQHELTKLNKDIQNTRTKEERYNVLKQQYELRKSEANFLRSKIQLSEHQAKLQDVQNLEKAVEQKQNLLNKCKEIKVTSQKTIKEIESKIGNTKSTRANELKTAEKAVADAKKKSDATQTKFKDFEAEIESLKMEIQEIIKNLPNLEVQVEKSIKTAEELSKNIEEIQTESKEIKENISSINKQVKEQKQVLKAHSAEISKLHKDKDAMLSKAESSKLQMQQLEHDIKRCKEQSTEAVQKVKKLVSTHKWIEEDKAFFGVKNTEYDFEKHDPKEAGKRIAKLEEEKGNMQNNVNMRAQNMLMTVEEQYKDLLEKREVVLNDKLRIEEVITELDDQKKKALKNACVQVNKDFGSIFSTLLPGTSAKLVPLDNKSVLEGLEFKVAFGDVWKESLTELSGGQRSLVALSLILSLLLFNPAPIYILDEVDAALDLSHTQNIGKMLRIHFKKSQFIVVSLKDGMFNNANVLFRTRFVDGMSTVSRHAQNQKRQHNE